MTGNHDWNRIGAVGQPDSARGLRIAEAAREFAVGNCFSVRDFAQPAPHRELKWSALGLEREIEGFQFSTEVGSKLPNWFAELLHILTPLGLDPHWSVSGYKLDRAQAGFISDQQQRSQRAFDLGEAPQTCSDCYSHFLLDAFSLARRRSGHPVPCAENKISD